MLIASRPICQKRSFLHASAPTLRTSGLTHDERPHSKWASLILAMVPNRGGSMNRLRSLRVSGGYSIGTRDSGMSEMS